MPTEVLYRYVNMQDVVLLETHYVAKRTPKGAWITDKFDFRKKRFVLDTGRKRFAYPTKEEAKESFLARKRRQLFILKAQVENVELAVLALKEDRIADYRGSVYFDL
jgi:hypothetical protein